MPVAGQPLHHLSCVVVGFTIRLCDSPWFLCLSHRQGAEKQHEVSDERCLQVNATKLLGLLGTTRDAATSEQAETARETTTGKKKNTAISCNGFPPAEELQRSCPGAAGGRAAFGLVQPTDAGLLEDEID